MRTCLERKISTSCRKTVSTLALALATDKKRRRVYHELSLPIAVAIGITTDHGKSGLLNQEHRARGFDSDQSAVLFTHHCNSVHPNRALVAEGRPGVGCLGVVAKHKDTRVARSCTTATASSASSK